MIVREAIPIDCEADWLELRKSDITSTQASALLGISPYLTREELFRMKVSGVVEQVYCSEAMHWGRRLEHIIAKEAEQRLGINLTKVDTYISIPELRIGSSFDYSNIDRTILVECKNVSYRTYKKSWTENTAPPHIETQVQHQMLVSGANEAYIAALVGGNRFITLHRTADESIHEKILTEAEKFWRSIDDDKAGK